jgi:hypothetical protein
MYCYDVNIGSTCIKRENERRLIVRIYDGYITYQQ